MSHTGGSFHPREVLKQDLFGRVERGILEGPGGQPREAVRRDLRQVSWILRLVARRLAGREARALDRLRDVEHVPRLLHWDGRILLRSWIPGRPLAAGAPGREDYFERARDLVQALHRRGITHNDLHKEPNLLVTPEGGPALVDFQLASLFRGRGPWFRMYVREDLRHLLKHKRTYRREALTRQERELLSRPSWIARLWRRTGKRLYLLVTRRLLGWRDREGSGPPAEPAPPPRR